MLNALRPYQTDIAYSILDSVIRKKGLTFTVEIARQGGKNEVSALIEFLLLARHRQQSKNLVKCSPTFKPQTVISMLRLKEKLNLSGYRRYWTSEMGYIIRLDQARAIFLSADESANVVGNTAHLLLEVDEAQDVDEDKYVKEFKPMASTTNAANVLYGTTWDDRTLLEKMKQTNLELERRDGIKRHFRYDWQAVAKYNPDYLAYVETERDRLGENHPLFLTQYRLLPIHGGGGFFNPLQKAQLQGDHPRLSHPSERIVINTENSQSRSLVEPRTSRPRSPSPLVQFVGDPGAVARNSELETRNSHVYVAGLDLAGESESAEDDFLTTLKPHQDSTVITIAELIPSPSPLSSWSGSEGSQGAGVGFEPALLAPSPLTQKLTANSSKLITIRIVHHYVWSGVKHPDLYRQMIDILHNVWHCRRIGVDATGIWQPVASFLKSALGSRVVPFVFTGPSKSELGFNLLAAVNSGSLKMYAADNSPEYQEFWFQVDRAKSHYRANRTLNFYVDPSEGHDDYLMSLALVLEAAGTYSPRQAHGKSMYSDFVTTAGSR